MEPNETESSVVTVLEEAERIAIEAVRSLRAALARAHGREVIAALDDVDDFLELLALADRRAAASRSAWRFEDALALAREARELARAARDDARRRGREALSAA